MDFKAVKGTRDFYPDQMRVRNWIAEAWRRASLRNGFEEYDSPIFEYLDLFTAKSGQEIAGQLFGFTDRGGRRLAIRPEITPSLARMVNARINSLPRPIKWFSLPRLCRAENPQRGRLREFFQWNVDVIGADSILADAECIYVAVDALGELGLSADDVCVRIGSRPLTVAALRAAGVPAELTGPALAVLDKRPRLSDEDFGKLAADAGLTEGQIAAVGRFQEASSLGELRSHFHDCDEVKADLDDLAELFATLEAMGAGDYCALDLRVVRGLAYYTGVVYEVFDRSQALRAVAGGGRYDNLLEVLGGPKVGATGFGMGDVVLGILLAEKGKLPDLSPRIEYFVIEATEELRPKVLEVVGALRRAGLSADFNYRPQSIGKQLKAANRRGAARAVIVRADGVSIKDLASGAQRDRALEEFLRAPAGAEHMQ